MPLVSTFWNKDRVKRLKELREEGHSASVIAAIIGAPSRSSVIGKLYRLGITCPTDKPLKRKKLKRVLSPWNRSGKANKPRAKNNRVSALFEGEPLPEIQADDIARKQLADLEPHECRWPVGDPGEPGFGFCAEQQFPGLPYCQAHSRRAYVLPPARKDTPAPFRLPDRQKVTA